MKRNKGKLKNRVYLKKFRWSSFFASMGRGGERKREEKRKTRKGYEANIQGYEKRPNVMKRIYRKIKTSIYFKML